MNGEAGFWDSWNTKERSGPPEADVVYWDLGSEVLGHVDRVAGRAPSIIEVGCGTGGFASRLSPEGAYLGVDISPRAIELAQARLPGRRFLAVDVHDWDPPGGESFDVAILLDSMAHFRDQAHVLSKVARLLRPGGHVVVTTPNPVVFSRLAWVKPPAEGQVRRWLSRAALRRLCEQSGLVVEALYTKFPAGNRGFLRVLNSPRLNRPLERVVPARLIARAKERCGLGRFQVLVARRPEHRSDDVST